MPHRVQRLVSPSPHDDDVLLSFALRSIASTTQDCDQGLFFYMLFVPRLLLYVRRETTGASMSWVLNL